LFVVATVAAIRLMRRASPRRSRSECSAIINALIRVRANIMIKSVNDVRRPRTAGDRRYDRVSQRDHLKPRHNIRCNGLSRVGRVCRTERYRPPSIEEAATNTWQPPNSIVPLAARLIASFCCSSEFGHD
jgi:hypothetical protein